MVGQHLREGVEEVLSVRSGDGSRLAALVGDLDLESHVEDVVRLLLAEVGEERVAVSRLQTSSAEWLQGIHEDDPRGDGGGEVLRVERTQRDVLPGLDVTGRPVVHQHQSKNVVFGLVDGNWLAEVVGLADKGGQFQLDVESLARREGGDLGSRGRIGQDLAVRSANGSPRGHDRRRTAVVPNWEMLVVGLQSVVGSAEEHTHVVGVVESGVEIGVVADLHRNMVGHLGEREESLLLERRVVLEDLRKWCVGTENSLDVLPDLAMDGTAESSERIQGRLVEHAQMRVDGRQLGKASIRGKHVQVQGIITDRDGRDVRGDFGGGDDAKGNVCQREGRVFGDLKPGSHGVRGGDVKMWKTKWKESERRIIIIITIKQPLLSSHLGNSALLDCGNFPAVA